jgi:hypothetical protein
MSTGKQRQLFNRSRRGEGVCEIPNRLWHALHVTTHLSLRTSQGYPCRLPLLVYRRGGAYFAAAYLGAVYLWQLQLYNYLRLEFQT